MEKVIKKIRDAGEYVVELVKAHDVNNTPFFAYVLLQKSNLEIFRSGLTAGNIKLADYGVILASGNGHEPSDEIYAEVQRKLRVN